MKLQDHNNPVQYRNIWIRPLRPRPIDGGLDGRLSKSVTLAKRALIAAEVRADAQRLEDSPRTLRLLESLVYEFDDTTWVEAAEMIEVYVEYFHSLSKERRQDEKKRVQNLHKALSFLSKHQRIEDTKLQHELQAIMKGEGWKK